MTDTQDNTEQQILDAAYEVFLEKGMDGTRMSDIAEKAGIKRTVVNYYFRTKEKLYKKVAKLILRQAMPVMLGVLNSDMSLKEKISQFVHNYISMAQRNPFMPIYIVNEVNKLGTGFIHELFDGNTPNVQPFIDHIQREVDAGNIRPVDPHQIILHIISLCLFPFLGKNIFMLMTKLEKDAVDSIIEARKQEVPKLIISYLYNEQ
ncbi:MAG: TetR/AcrR family transcriptional regulator [Bacteroidia bacterium]